jgi:exopolysaccharide biosynthesis polyprenyl glycosylphosphotransferase
LQAAPLETAVVGKVVAWATILFASVVRLTNWQVIPADLLLVSAPLNYFAMLGLRRAYKLRGRVQGPSVRNVLIVGAYRLGNEIAQYINQYHPGGRFFRGFLDDSQPLAAEVRGRISDLPKIARAHFIDEVILAMPQQRELAQQLAGEARRNHLDVKIVPDLFGFAPPPDALENYGQVPVVRLHSERPPVLGLLLKRAVDCFAAVIALLLSSPVMLAIAALIKIDSPGPVFYCAPRMGKKGREFLCYKFRTMATNAEAMKEVLRATNQREGPFFKMANDPRLTQIGRFLRRYSLDELPQLWNVLAGEMSLVGPRPHPLDDFRRYRLEDFRRLDVTPGITGLWQVTARRDPSFQRSMALDLQYIEQWSVLLDLKILWKTFFVVFHGTGA